MKAKNTKPHHVRKNMGSAEFFRKQRKARNAARPKQRWFDPNAFMTAEEFFALTDEKVLALPRAGWVR
jgi:hypothetical protein